MAVMDVKFFKPFVEGTVQTLGVQCSIVATPGKPFFKGSQVQPEFGIAGILGIACPTFSGSIVLCFPEKVFLKVVGGMFAEEITELRKELEDGAAEIMNMIYGHAKRILNEQGHKLEKALPTVIRGSSISTVHATDKPVVVLPFQTMSGEFHIEISWKQSSEAGGK